MPLLVVSISTRFWQSSPSRSAAPRPMEAPKLGGPRAQGGEMSGQCFHAEAGGMMERSALAQAHRCPDESGELPSWYLSQPFRVLRGRLQPTRASRTPPSASRADRAARYTVGVVFGATPCATHVAGANWRRPVGRVAHIWRRSLAPSPKSVGDQSIVCTRAAPLAASTPDAWPPRLRWGVSTKIERTGAIEPRYTVPAACSATAGSSGA